MLQSKLQSPSQEEVKHIFEALDTEILRATKLASKDVYLLTRDKVMFLTMYSAGLRIEETLNLNVSSFTRGQRMPEGDKSGGITVLSKYSGRRPKLRFVPVWDPQFSTVMECYLEEVRVRFLNGAAPDEVALFLSQQGKRLSAPMISQRFKHLMEIAGLREKKYTPQMLRHSAIHHDYKAGRLGIDEMCSRFYGDHFSMRDRKLRNTLIFQQVNKINGE